MHGSFERTAANAAENMKNESHSKTPSRFAIGWGSGGFKLTENVTTISYINTHTIMCTDVKMVIKLKGWVIGTVLLACIYWSAVSHITLLTIHDDGTTIPESFDYELHVDDCDECVFTWYLIGPVAISGTVVGSDLKIKHDVSGKYTLSVVTHNGKNVTLIREHHYKTNGHNVVTERSRICKDLGEMAIGKWVLRSELQNLSFPVIPPQRLNENGDCYAMFHNSPNDNIYMGKSQQYVWVPDTCYLPWVDALPVNDKTLVFIGSSRMRNLYRDFQKYSPSARVKYEVFARRDLSGIEKIHSLTTRYCHHDTKTVIIFSTGLWEAAFALEGKDLQKIEYTGYITSILSLLYDRCGSRLVLVTEPAVHSPVVYGNKDTGIITKKRRTMYINSVMRDFAFVNSIPIVDAEKLTEARFGAAQDGTHYVCGRCNIKLCPKTGGMGSVVMQTIIQLLVRII